MGVDKAHYDAVRANVGLFDATNYYGRLFVRGKDALDLLNRMSSNDVTPLEKGNGAVLTALLNEKGRFIDILKAVRDSAGDTLLITSKDKEQTIISWLDKFTIMEDARFERATEKISQFVLLGSKAPELISRHCEVNSIGIVNAEINGVPATVFCEAQDRFYILVLAEGASVIWDALRLEVQQFNGSLMNESLFNLLRIEAGIAVAPNEINEKHNPLELPLAQEAISFTKGCYIGQEVIARLDAQNKVQRRLVGLSFSEASAQTSDTISENKLVLILNKIPNIGDRITDESLIDSPLGNEIGEVTSVAESPEFGFIGLGFVRGKYTNPGTVLSVRGEAGILPVTIQSLPFHA